MLRALTRLFAVMLTLAAVAWSQMIFKGSARLVNVPVAVKDTAGKFVRDLRPEDFHVFDNGRPQRFKFDYGDEPVALAVAVQTTASVRAWLPHVRRVASAIETLIIAANGEAAVIRFGADVALLQDWANRAESIDSAFASLASTSDDKRVVSTPFCWPRTRSPRCRPPSGAWFC